VTSIDDRAQKNHEALAAAFGQADAAHFEWQTEAAGVAECEQRLVEAAFLPLRERVVDLGCGEGATLVHLGRPTGARGIELFPDKVKFASEQLPHCQIIEGSVYELPFEAGSFDQVIIRDVVHHLDEPSRFFAECRRVMAPGARIDVLEPCRYNPLVFWHALTNRAERGELRSTPRYLRALVEPHFRVEKVERHQAFPVHRVVYHPKLGRPALAHNSWVDAAVRGAEELSARVVPRIAWAYIHVRAWLD
jgi:SAM-dependent methyltransferase